MHTTVINHPLVAERLTRLRQTSTTNVEFRKNLYEVSIFLIYEALKEIRVTQTSIETPLAPTSGYKLESYPIIVPVLRAGLGMMDAALFLLPEARVGFIGARRDETTLQPDLYLNTIPEGLNGAHVLILDPALATGGSMIQALELAHAAGAGMVTLVSLLASPEGIEAIDESGLDPRIVTASIDEKLNDIGFIYPGLGDAGDRQYGVH
ncbi:MAG: uracil phosphoribosyltransferase [Acidimicrobiales bacterium]|jgi:uracil phosphoribosyltransferase|nr:uracil phosphoribosyltransferase [Acidimicrobiales bacterium]